jgi:hypothetical protein
MRFQVLTAVKKPSFRMTCYVYVQGSRDVIIEAAGVL